MKNALICQLEISERYSCCLDTLNDMKKMDVYKLFLIGGYKYLALYDTYGLKISGPEHVLSAISTSSNILTLRRYK